MPSARLPRHTEKQKDKGIIHLEQSFNDDDLTFIDFISDTSLEGRNPLEIIIKDYDYKGELPQFAKDRGYSDKDSFVEKYGKDKIVKNMIIQKAQDIVMDNAVYK